MKPRKGWVDGRLAPAVVSPWDGKHMQGMVSLQQRLSLRDDSHSPLSFPSLSWRNMGDTVPSRTTGRLEEKMDMTLTPFRLLPRWEKSLSLRLRLATSCAGPWAVAHAAAVRCRWSSESMGNMWNGRLRVLRYLQEIEAEEFSIELKRTVWTLVLHTLRHLLYSVNRQLFI